MMRFKTKDELLCTVKGKIDDDGDFEYMDGCEYIPAIIMGMKLIDAFNQLELGSDLPDRLEDWMFTTDPIPTVWVNLYVSRDPAAILDYVGHKYTTREAADASAASDRVACVEVKV
jgi:hypothetical protein